MAIKNVDEANVRLSFGRKCAYALVDFGNNFSWSFVSSFLMYFWTENLGIAAGTAGIIMALSRVWDAINDPLVGRWADHTNSRFGRYRPWILRFTFPLAALNILCFSNFGIQSNAGKVAYAAITFFILVFLYTCVNVPYSAMEAALTLDANERGSIATFRLFFAYCAAITLTFTTQRLVGAFGKGDDGRGYMMTAILFSVIMLVSHLVGFANTKEIVISEPEHTSLADNFKALKGNWPVIILSVGFLVYGFYYYGRSSVILYYYTYNAGNALAYSTYSVINLGSSLLGVFLLGTFAYKLKNKATVPMVSFLVSGVLTFILYWVNPTTGSGMILIYVVSAVIGVFMGMATTMIYGMVPDTTEYTQLHYGLRASGFISAFVNFFLKVGMALGTGGVGVLMSALGYVANQQQTPQVLTGINLMFSIIPGVLSIVAAILMKAYPIDQKMYNNILEQLKAKGE